MITLNTPVITITPVYESETDDNVVLAWFLTVPFDGDLWTHLDFGWLRNYIPDLQYSDYDPWWAWHWSSFSLVSGEGRRNNCLI